MTRAAPLWLVQPSRFAGLSPAAARRVLALVALLLVAALPALHAPASSPDHLALYQTIADGVRHGGDYYPVAVDALREAGEPLRPFLAFRLPTLAVTEGAAPRLVVIVAMYLLAAAVLLAWRRRLAPALVRPAARWAATLLLLGAMAAVAGPDIVVVPELWAGLLIALSLALRRRGRWVEAAALGLAAILIRETAALYVVVMTAGAMVEGERREASGWVGTLGVLAVALALHAHAVVQVVRPLDAAWSGWTSGSSLGFLARTTSFGVAPGWIAAPLVGLALLGWAAWRDPLAIRALSTIIGYAAAIGLIGQADPVHAALLVAPILPLGLVFAPDGLRDLILPALDTRRITVKRVVR